MRSRKLKTLKNKRKNYREAPPALCVNFSLGLLGWAHSAIRRLDILGSYFLRTHRKLLPCDLSKSSCVSFMRQTNAISVLWTHSTRESAVYKFFSLILCPNFNNIYFFITQSASQTTSTFLYLSWLLGIIQAGEIFAGKLVSEIMLSSDGSNKWIEIPKALLIFSALRQH